MTAADISEVLEHTPRRRLSFYFVLLFVVGPVWLAVPSCWLYVFYALFTKDLFIEGWKGYALFTLASAEVVFNIYYRYLVRQLDVPTTTPIRTVEELEETLSRVLKAGLISPDVRPDKVADGAARPASPWEDVAELDYNDPRACDFRHAFRTWFYRVPWSQVRRHECRQWLYWAIYNADMPPLERMSTQEQEVLERALGSMEKRIGRKIPEGSNPETKPFRISLDTLNVYSRPLVMYAIIFAINWVTTKRLQWKYQFEFSSYNGMEYAIRTPKTWNPSSKERPIVFFYGLGSGISQYKVALTRIIRQVPDRPLLVIMQPHISQDIFHPNYLNPFTREETTERLAGLLDSLGWANASTDLSKEALVRRPGSELGVTMLSHSNGTYGHTWMLKDKPHMISRNCLIDPVCFSSWEGDTCFNFLYRPCTNGLHLFMRYFVSSELGIAYMLTRRFDWTSNALWASEIPNASDVSKTLFVLGGKDLIIKAHRARQYLVSHGIGNSLHYDETGQHGQALMLTGESHQKIMSWLRQT
ncbi:hypothetical protein CYLTODRAFT_416320 [Cylindrobasidium torrendii FP15055 ss-10]|uniref:Alpha/beta-hydrolase n=1 Tax=Cylindrobasidium torrendii FP15055 ss-10 TaxID=1314674 RepID=A0A0D7BU31_9AGAR|nr:hypothetical protein CYLTODRAFT_416320 [Cylindrobasidium torrendii FP15055 ss-10]